MIDLTQNEFISKYCLDKVNFYSYFNYIFIFEGVTTDGCRITVSVGGQSDDIYRMEVSNDMEYTIGAIYPFAGSIYKDGVLIEGFYEQE
jgi:hypothetical protein